MGVLTRAFVVAAVVLSGLSLGAPQAEAQRASAPELTAAFLFNFVKFTTWPAAALQDDAPLLVCVIDSDQAADSLSEITRNETVGGRPIVIRRVSLHACLGACHVVYGGDMDAARSQQLLEATSGQPILTVGASFDFAERGGVANFYLDKGRMRFAVNPTAADRAQLRISSKLLSLARIVDHVGPT